MTKEQRVLNNFLSPPPQPATASQEPEKQWLFESWVCCVLLFTSDTWELHIIFKLPSPNWQSHPESTLTQGVNKPASVHQGNVVCLEGSVCAGQHTATGIKARAGGIVIMLPRLLKEAGWRGPCSWACVHTESVWCCWRWKVTHKAASQKLWENLKTQMQKKTPQKTNKHNKKTKHLITFEYVLKMFNHSPCDSWHRL